MSKMRPLGRGYLELTSFTFTAIYLKWFKIITSNLVQIQINIYATLACSVAGISGKVTS